MRPLATALLTLIPTLLYLALVAGDAWRAAGLVALCCLAATIRER